MESENRTRLADALEAATRVPVQGEPNGDRCLGCGSAEEDGHDDCTVTIRTIRATVPDAATATVKVRVKFEGDLPIEELKRQRDAALEARDGWAARMGEFTAALAAVERVRAIHKVKHGERPVGALGGIQSIHKPTRFEKYSMCEGCSATWPCPTIAALDGAPETEWEYRALCVFDDDPRRINHYVSRSTPYTQDEMENPPLMGTEEHGMPEINRLVKQERRRKAGPWLPVEGESNGA